MSNVETKAQFAKRLGVNRSTITRWGKAGRLVLAKNGKVLVQESLAQIKATEGHRSDLKQKHAQQRGQPLQTATPSAQNASVLDESPDMQADSALIGEDRAHYKAIALDSKNQLDNLETALKQGERLYKDQFTSSIAKQANYLKNGIERLIDNLAPQIANQPQAERLQKIQQEINQLINQTA